MTNHELKKIVDQVMKDKGYKLAFLAKEAKVNRSHLSTTINEKEKFEVPGGKMLQNLAKAFPSYFPEAMRETKNQQENQQTGFVPIEKYVQKLEKMNSNFQKVLEANLTALATTQHIILAQIKAGQKYHVRREAKGNKKQELADLLEISTFSRDYFEAMTKVGMNAEEGM